MLYSRNIVWHALAAQYFAAIGLLAVGGGCLTHQVSIDSATATPQDKDGPPPTVGKVVQLDGVPLPRDSSLGSLDELDRQSQDKAWRTRQKAAKSLVHYSGARAERIALRLITDRQPAVQMATVEAIDSWPLVEAGPVLLAAMSLDTYLPRKAAETKLAARWPVARQFPVDGTDRARAASLKEIKALWIAQYPRADRPPLDASSAFGANETPARSTTAVNHFFAEEQLVHVRQVAQSLEAGHLPEDQAHAARLELRALGSDLLPALEQLAGLEQVSGANGVLTGILAEQEPLFSTLELLNDARVPQRRATLLELAKLAADRPLPVLALNRLNNLLAHEPDGGVWQAALALVASDGREAAARLAYVAIGHSSPEVRRRACEHLAAHPSPEHLAVLWPALRDTHGGVVRAAVLAIAAQGEVADASGLVPLLDAPDRELRVTTAAALCQLHQPAGPAALERLSYDPESKIRRETATAMGQLADSQFFATLMRLLDDRQDVRVAALASLLLVTGRDAPPGAEPFVGVDQQIQCWKAWQRQQAQSGNSPGIEGRPSN